MIEDKILKKIKGKKHPIEKYKNERKFLKNRIINLLQKRILPIAPITLINVSSEETLALESQLSGRSFLNLSKKEQSLLLGDIYFLTNKAFHYYIFEIMILLLSKEEICDSSIIQQLFIENKNRFIKFNKNEIEVIIAFLTNISNEIKNVIGDRTLYNKLEDWERVEVYHPFINWEEKINENIVKLKKAFL